MRSVFPCDADERVLVWVALDMGWLLINLNEKKREKIRAGMCLAVGMGMAVRWIWWDG